MLINALRGHPAGFGLIEGQGLHEIEDTQTRIAGLETQVIAWHKSNPVSPRLATIPGIEPIIATAIAATVADPNIFHSGREFAASLGLVPRRNSTGWKNGGHPHTRQPVAVIRFPGGYRNSSEGALAGSKLSINTVVTTERK